MMISTQFAV